MSAPYVIMSECAKAHMPKTAGPVVGVSKSACRGKSFLIRLFTFLSSGRFFVYRTKLLSAGVYPLQIYKEVKQMAKVELKQPVVEEISAQIKDAQSVVLVDYRGLTVEQDTLLRKNLREAGVTYKVYKNTMMTRAFKGTAFEGLAPYLEGPSAVAISTTDATAPARILADFAKTANKLEIKGGVVEGTVYDAAGMAAIASIPSREVLISRLLGSMKSPISNFARVINQVAEKGGAAACVAE